MNIQHKKENIREIVKSLKSENKTIGFVPTMGALHLGHLSLIQQAQSQNDIVIISIFVNPTQFDNAKDLEKYPRTLDLDVALLQTISDDYIIYAPNVKDVYGDEIASDSFQFDGLEFEMEGKFRQGHFDGVATIVKRLFEIVQPDRAYFGKKDFQQFRIIQTLVENYNLPVEIIGCEIFRENDGLAMSSRNIRLSKIYRSAAPFIYETIKKAKIKFLNNSAEEVTEWVEKQFLEHPLLKLEYFIIADEETLEPVKNKLLNKQYRAFIAVYADDIRLIDNIALN